MTELGPSAGLSLLWWWELNGGYDKAEAKKGGFRAFNGSSEPRIIFSRVWGAPEDFFVCFWFFSFELHFMFIDHFGITSTLLFPPIEGSLK